jgi:hypothetical protein
MEVDAEAVVKRALKNKETRQSLARELWKHTPFCGEVEKVVFWDAKGTPVVQDTNDGWVDIYRHEPVCNSGHYISLKQKFTYNDVVRYCPFILDDKEAVSHSLKQISCYLDNLLYVLDKEQIKALARMALEELNVVKRYLESNQKEN